MAAQTLYLGLATALSANNVPTEQNGTSYARQSTSVTYDPGSNTLAFTGVTFIAGGSWTANTNVVLYDASSNGNVLAVWPQATAALASGGSYSIGSGVIQLSKALVVGTSTLAGQQVIGTVPNAVNVTVNVSTGVNPWTVSSAYLISTVGAVVALTDAATISYNVALGSYATVTIGATGRTLTMTGAYAGQVVYVDVVQDGTGSRTITTYTNVTWNAGTGPTLSTAAAAIDTLRFTWQATAQKWRGETVGKAFA